MRLSGIDVGLCHRCGGEVNGDNGQFCRECASYVHDRCLVAHGGSVGSLLGLSDSKCPNCGTAESCP